MDVTSDIEWPELAEFIGDTLGRGRVRAELTTERLRGLTEEELILGARMRRTANLPTSVPPAIQRIRSRHHLMAQMLASGLKPTEVAQKTGYSISRVSILQADPAFKELVSNYRGQSENLFFDVKERLRL